MRSVIASNMALELKSVDGAERYIPTSIQPEYPAESSLEVLRAWGTALGAVEIEQAEGAGSIAVARPMKIDEVDCVASSKHGRPRLRQLIFGCSMLTVIGATHLAEGNTGALSHASRR